MAGERASGVILSVDWELFEGKDCMYLAYVYLWLCHSTSCSKYLLSGVLNLEMKKLCLRLFSWQCKVPLLSLAKSITLHCVPQYDFKKAFGEKEENQTKPAYSFFKNNSFSVNGNASSLKVHGVISPRHWNYYPCHLKPMEASPSSPLQCNL